MYKYKLPAEYKALIIANANRKSGFINALTSLEQNPLSRAKPVRNSNNFGQYYVNAGNKFAICFNIDENEKEISIVYICRKAFLHKILTQQIN